MLEIAQARSQSTRCEAPYRVNAWLTALAIAAALAQLFAVPILLLPHSPGLAAAAVALLSFLAPLSRALLHEAVHGRLLRARRSNDRLGRALAIIYGIAFDVMRFGHLTHHRFPRHAFDRADVIAPGENRLYACLRYYSGLIGWFYLREILAGAIVLLPRGAIENLTGRALKRDDSLEGLSAVIRRRLDRSLRRSRVDLALAAVIYGASITLYGAYWPALAAGLAMRALLTSLLDNVAHYGTPAVTGAPAHDLSASRWLGLAILNGNLHGAHHDRPEIPWSGLPTIHEESGKRFAGGYVGFLIAQFLGPRQAASDDAMR